MGLDALYSTEATDLPYFVIDEIRGAGVAHVADNKFHMFRPGKLGVIVPTSNNVVVSREFAVLLQQLVPDQLRIFDVTIHNPRTKSEIDAYVELGIDRTFGSDALPQDVRGFQVWRFQRGSLFVSPALREKIAARFPTLKFSAGLRIFAAG